MSDPPAFDDAQIIYLDEHYGGASSQDGQRELLPTRKSQVLETSRARSSKPSKRRQLWTPNWPTDNGN